MHLPTICAALGCLLAFAAQAQSIQRCQQDGKLSYTDQPCPAGADSSHLAVPAALPVGAHDASALQRQAALAEQLRQRRVQRETQEERKEQRAAQGARKQQQKCQRLRLAQRWAEDDASRAPMNQRAAAQRKASRGAQALALECARL